MKSTLSALLLSLMPCLVSADWRTDIGWDELQEWASLNSMTLPDTSGLAVGMSEAGTTAYAPDFNDIQLSDESIIDVTGESIIPSSHATGVASQFFGNSSSMTPSVASVNIYSADDFIDKIKNDNSGLWTERVMSHAWIGSVGSSQGTEILSARLDATTINSDTLHIVGVNNGSAKTLPELLNQSYNGISVGISSGNHSRGPVPDGYEGAGRQKPEVVNSLGSSSSATGATASVATLLRAQASSATSVAIKSVILAGADKLKFEDWDNSSTRPIDDIYGAGEVNILNSFRILSGGEQSAGSIGSYGWDYFSPGGRNRFPQAYTLTIPDNSTSSSLCANLSWNRASSGGSYSTLANLSLTLTDSSDVVVFSSDSSVDNIEHIWQTNLSPGTYTITVARNGSVNADYALAWRVDTETNSSPSSFNHGATSNDLVFANLAPLHKYILQRSSKLSAWVDISTTESLADGSLSVSDPNSELGEKVFYRLRYYTP